MTLHRPLFAFFLVFAFSLSLSTPSTAKESAAEFQGAEYVDNPLASPDFTEISTLGQFDLMVSRGRWNNIQARDILAELKKFDGVQGSPALRDIWRDILLGDFSGVRFHDDSEQSALMAERLRILNRLGFFDEAVRLYLEAAQEKPIPENVARQGVDSLALSGSADGACLEVKMANRYLRSKEWDNDNALCMAYFGEGKIDPGSGSEAFRTVLNMLEGNSGKTIQVGLPPLWRTLLLARGATISQPAIDKADAMTLSALAENPKVPFGIRLAAANRAADAGTIGADKLRLLYETKNPTDASASGFVAPARAGADLAQADYYAAARFTFEGTARSEIVRSAMRHLHPVTNVKGQTYGWIVDKLTLQVDKLGWFAPYGFAVMVETNRRASADMYYQTGHLEASPLAIVDEILDQTPWAPEAQIIWSKAMEAAGKKDMIAPAFNLARAFDQENRLAINERAAIQTDESPPTGVLDDSIRKGGRGLTLLAAINKLAEAKQMNRISPSETSEIITNLGRQGLFGERKKITLEILLQSVL